MSAAISGLGALAACLLACGQSSHPTSPSQGAAVGSRARALPPAAIGAPTEPESNPAELASEPVTLVEQPPQSEAQPAATVEPTARPEGPGILTAPRPPPAVLTPLPELCRQACTNAQRLVEAELAADTAEAMRREVERSLARECPGRCLQRASLESARCIAGAKSALELAACP